MMSYFDVNGQLHLNEPAPKVIWVPSRWVSILQVFVPGKSRRQWQEALPYALEEQLAQPLEEVHLIALERDKQGVTQVAVVARAQMQAWLAELEKQGLTQALLVAECFALATQAKQADDKTDHKTDNSTDNSWISAPSMIEADSLLLRSGELRGASMANGLWANWFALVKAQQPDITIEQLRQTTPADTPLSLLRKVNLRQGEFSPQAKSSAASRAWRWPAGLAAIWLLLVGVQTHWQTEQTLQQAQAYQQQTETLFRQLFPQTQRIVNIQVQTQSFLNQSGQSAASLAPVELLSLIEPHLLAQNAIKPGRMDWQNQRFSLQLTGRTTEQLDQLLAKVKADLPVGLNARLQIQSLTGSAVEGVLHVDAN
jgi:general secretion pathway protein L